MHSKWISTQTNKTRAGASIAVAINWITSTSPNQKRASILKRLIVIETELKVNIDTNIFISIYEFPTNRKENHFENVPIPVQYSVAFIHSFIHSFNWMLLTWAKQSVNRNRFHLKQQKVLFITQKLFPLCSKCGAALMFPWMHSVESEKKIPEYEIELWTHSQSQTHEVEREVSESINTNICDHMDRRYVDDNFTTIGIGIEIDVCLKCWFCIRCVRY